MDKLYIDYLPLEDLLNRFAKRNPKDHDLGAMHTSINRFGYVSPVMLDESTGRIVAGHGRLLALEQMRKSKADPPPGVQDGWAVPVVRGKAFKSEKEAEAYLLADNRLTELGGWNLAEVKDMLADLTVDLGDMDWLGFEWLDGEGPEPPEPKEKDSIDILKAGSLSDLTPTQEEIDRIGDRDIYVEFSGGKDSSAAVVWIKKYLPNHNVQLYYVDLGADHVGFILHLHRFARWIGYPLTVLRSKENLIDVMLQKREWPKFRHPYCHEMLHDAFHAGLADKDPDKIIIMRGGRVEESAAQSKKQTNRFLQLSTLKTVPCFQPLYFAGKDTADQILITSGAPLWEGYARGLQRTACRVCPGQRTGTYAAIREYMPDTWAELKELEKLMGYGCWYDPIGNAGQGQLEDNANRGARSK